MPLTFFGRDLYMYGDIWNPDPLGEAGVLYSRWTNLDDDFPPDNLVTNIKNITSGLFLKYSDMGPNRHLRPTFWSDVNMTLHNITITTGMVTQA